MRLHYLVTVVIVICTALTVSTARGFAHTVRGTDVSVSRNSRTRNLDNGDEERAGGGISVSVSEKLATLFKSSKVTDEQLQKWLDMGKSAEDVFNRMKLAKAHTSIFSNPQFSKWVQYADDLSATASGKGTSAISTLTAQYGDDQLYKLLKVPKRDSSSKELASRLQNDQLKHWIVVGKDPDEVYKLYDLSYAAGSLLRDPKFSAWAKYVDDVNAKHEGAISIIPTLRKYYSDRDLFKMAEATKGVDKLESVGLKLENAFVQFWVNDKKTLAKVLAEFRLEATAKTLESPLFGLLAKFMDAYNVKFPQTKTTMIEAFTDAFGDENVAKMLAAVKAKDGKAKKIATELEAAQLQMWLSSGKSVDEVYDLLNLPYRRLHYDFGENPLFPTWIAYMNSFSMANPDKVSQLLSTMATQFKERPMMQILQAAEKFPSMENFAVTLQLQKAEKFFATGVSPKEAFTAVAIDSVGDSVLSSPVFTKWMSYVEDFNKKNPAKEESWFLPLRANYNLGRLIDTARKTPKTAKIADMVESARMEAWLSSEESPKYVFRFLDLNNAGEKTFSSPNFDLWVKYLNDFNRKYPGEKTTMIDSIRANYQDFRLVRILNEAEKVPSTEKLAKNVQNVLFDKWVEEKKTVAYLKQWIGHVPSSNVWIQRYTEKLSKMS